MSNSKFFIIIFFFVIAILFISLGSKTVEPVHLTGLIKHEGILLNKKHITIDMNGYHVFDGYLDQYNQAELFGQYNGNQAKAKCSGAETINCMVEYGSFSQMITFKIKDNK